MTRYFIILFCFVLPALGRAQYAPGGRVFIKLVTDQSAPVSGASVELLRLPDSTLVKVQVTDSSGSVQFGELAWGRYCCRISGINFPLTYSDVIILEEQAPVARPGTIQVSPFQSDLATVTVSARKPFVQLMPGKTVVNVASGITNAGATVLEVLEKSPGLTVDKDGNISLKGKPSVLVLIDGKPTYLSGAELANLLGGMSASQAEQIEIMDNPPARYDAAGNAGVINIRLHKEKSRGFNGNLNLSAGQGVYPKQVSSAQFNYRSGNWNLFVNYGINTSQYFTDLYALRRYYATDETSITALLEQPFFNRARGHTQTLRTGAEYQANKSTLLGVTLTGLDLLRKNQGNSTATWMKPGGQVDSTIYTHTSSSTRWHQGGVNLNLREQLTERSDLTADLDYIQYRMQGDQYFENVQGISGGYTQGVKGDIPSSIKIYSAKTDYNARLRGGVAVEAGWKSSRVHTDNEALYYTYDGGGWQADLARSNHFLYTEIIHAAYASAGRKSDRWSYQLGLRFEATNYDAHQLGNAAVKDSSFSRTYQSLFPNANISFQLDSINQLVLSAGRRIDRPPFQQLNPFIFVINKYTFQQGNPFILPQYTWNFEIQHQYREMLITGLSYAISHDYFSQIFLSDTASGNVIYTQGNVGSMQNLGISVSLQLAPAKWWSLSAQAVMNHKKISGFIWRQYDASITQFTGSMNNQFRFRAGWGAELSAFYVGRSQNDLTEVLDPTGQVSAGLSKQVLKKQGTLRLSVRDIFYTQRMQGLTDLLLTKEFFNIKRDSRLIMLALSWRFGKNQKTTRRQTGGAGDEMERVGVGN